MTFNKIVSTVEEININCDCEKDLEWWAVFIIRRANKPFFNPKIQYDSGMELIIGRSGLGSEFIEILKSDYLPFSNITSEMFVGRFFLVCQRIELRVDEIPSRKKKHIVSLFISLSNTFFLNSYNEDKIKLGFEIKFDNEYIVTLKYPQSKHRTYRFVHHISSSEETYCFQNQSLEEETLGLSFICTKSKDNDEYVFLYSGKGSGPKQFYQSKKKKINQFESHKSRMPTRKSPFYNPFWIAVLVHNYFCTLEPEELNKNLIAAMKLIIKESKLATEFYELLKEHHNKTFDVSLRLFLERFIIVMDLINEYCPEIPNKNDRYIAAILISFTNWFFTDKAFCSKYDVITPLFSLKGEDNICLNILHPTKDTHQDYKFSHIIKKNIEEYCFISELNKFGLSFACESRGDKHIFSLINYTFYTSRTLEREVLNR
ncbi:MAG: hypothetical protein HRT90_08745 [Candidatus Margulisbacteria bacterium]|nr:hypothetical protein [Candidatus Margulisiibacteriota bacterium]